MPGPGGAVWFGEAHKLGWITSSGAITECSIPAEGPFQLALGSDGAIWWTEQVSSKIGRLSRDAPNQCGATVEYPLTPGSEPTDIKAGPDGALWFKESGPNRIGRITTGGRLTELALPSGPAPSIEDGLAFSSAHSLWLTECGQDKIGMLPLGR